jgi:hypothetical protein
MEIVFEDTYNEGKFTLSVTKNYNTYECCIEELESEHIELSLLGEAIIEGTKQNPAKRLDDNLTNKTTFQISGENEEKMQICLVMTYQKGKLKPKTETHTYELTKKETDHNSLFQNMLKDFQQGLSLYQICPGTQNVYVFVNPSDKHIYYVHTENKVKIHLSRNNILHSEFLEFLVQNDAKISEYFSNRQNSQEAIEKFVGSYLESSFLSQKIYESVLNYLGHLYHINFVAVGAQGTRIICNVSPNKLPKDTKYFVCEKLYKFEFKPPYVYTILQQFETEVITSKVFPKLEIVSFGGKFTILENGVISKDREIFCSNGLSLLTNSEGHLSKITNEGVICKSQTLVSPSQYLKISTNERGHISSVKINSQEDTTIIQGVGFIFQTLQGAVQNTQLYLLQASK